MRNFWSGGLQFCYLGEMDLNGANSNIPTPYYALSNLLTLFSHDMPTLPLIQHTYDYLFVRPPVACVYVAAVVGLSVNHYTPRLIPMHR